jgi:Amt family ammonium transporter
MSPLFVLVDRPAPVVVFGMRLLDRWQLDDVVGAAGAGSRAFNRGGWAVLQWRLFNWSRVARQLLGGRGLCLGVPVGIDGIC